MVKGKIAEIDAKVAAVATSRQNLANRLTFLLQDSDLEVASSFQDEYKRQFSSLNDEERELEDGKRQFQFLQKQISEKRKSHNKEWQEHTHKAIGYIKKKN